MTTIQVSAELEAWLARKGMGPERTGSAKPPAKFHRESVNTDRGEAVGVNYGTNIDAAMAKAMRNEGWRLVRASPFLMILCNE